MSILDWILAAIVILIALRCLVRVFVKEAASIAGEIAGLACALLFYKKVGTFINSLIPLGNFAEFVGFFAAFLVGFIVVLIIGRLLREGLEAAHLERLDSFLGFIGGILEGAVVISVLLVLIQIQPLFDTRKILAESRIASIILPVIGPTVNATLNPIIGPKGSLPRLLQPQAKPATK
jgi:membrane protein required for colicin V production